MGYEQLPHGALPVSASTVKAPAIALIVTSSLNLLISLVLLVMHVAGVAMPKTVASGNEQSERVAQLLAGGIGLVLYGVIIVAAVFAIYGLTRMMAFRSWGLSLAAVILGSVLPWACCCCLPMGLPFGVWGLIVLLQSNVKAAFTD